MLCVLKDGKLIYVQLRALTNCYLFYGKLVVIFYGKISIIIVILFANTNIRHYGRTKR